MATKMKRAPANVFRDLGFSPADAENLRIRSDLMIQLMRIIEDRGLTQVEAAGLMGVTQPRISDLVRGKIERFSVDGLIAMLGRAGATISLTVRTTRRVA